MHGKIVYTLNDPVKRTRSGCSEVPARYQRAPLGCLTPGEPVPCDERVMGDEENALDLSLSDQQAVERILVQIG